jgi:hypothetical protein
VDSRHNDRLRDEHSGRHNDSGNGGGRAAGLDEFGEEGVRTFLANRAGRSTYRERV